MERAGEWQRAAEKNGKNIPPKHGCHRSTSGITALQVLQDSFNLLDLNPEVRRQKKREAGTDCWELC